MPMDWDKLRVFHAVAEAGSFTHAGEELNLSQSAVSRQISALEQELKVPLFQRHARGLVRTEEGNILYRTTHDVYSMLKSVRTQLSDSRDRPSGPLRVTTTVGLGANWVTPRLREFIERFPEVQLELLLSNSDLDLATRDADVAIRLHVPDQGDLIQRRLFTVHFHIYASPEYLRSHGTPRTLEELKSHNIITYGQTPPYLKELNWLETVMRDEHIEPILKIDNINAIKHAAANGIGIALLPDYVIGSTPNLVRVPVNANLPEFETYLVYPEEQRAAKRVAVFRDFMVAKARQWSY